MLHIIVENLYHSECVWNYYLFVETSRVLIRVFYFIVVYHVKRARHHCWQCSEVTFWCTDEQLCNRWIHALKELLDLQSKLLRRKLFPMILLVRITVRESRMEKGAGGPQR